MKLIITQLWIFVLAIPISLLVGCSKHRSPEPKPPPLKPTIKVEKIEGTESIGLKIRFFYLHKYYDDVWVDLNSLEDLRDYKREVEFLLNRIEEAERRMEIHEPQTVK
jgi:hypothetical protein